VSNLERYLSGLDFQAAGLVAREMARRPKRVAASADGVYRGFASVSDEVRVPLADAARFRLTGLLRRFMAEKAFRFDQWPEAMPSVEVEDGELVFRVARPMDEARGRKYAGTVGVREF
jgi:hypothetical protein